MSVQVLTAVRMARYAIELAQQAASLIESLDDNEIDPEEMEEITTRANDAKSRFEAKAQRLGAAPPENDGSG